MGAEDRPAREALAWFARLGRDGAERDLPALHEWVAADPLNWQEFSRLKALWLDLDRIPDPRLRPVSAPHRAPTRRAFLAGGALAGIAALLGTGVVLDMPTALAADLRTDTGEQREATLPDGSRVLMDAETALVHDVPGERRQVQLLKGRARFAPAADPRPFEVLCDAGLCSATEAGRFTVHRLGGAVRVLAQQGGATVRLARGGSAISLMAGQALDYRETEIGLPYSPDLATATAWERGWLVFEDRPLRAVIEEVNYYRHGRIVVFGGKLEALRVNGSFDLRRPERSLSAILSTLPVRAYWLSRYLVLIREA